MFGALSQDGILRFISLNTYKIVFSVGGNDTIISHVSVSPSGKHLAIVLDSGSCQVSHLFILLLKYFLSLLLTRYVTPAIFLSDAVGTFLSINLYKALLNIELIFLKYMTL